ncbi:MAG: PilZ domain-containing protein [Candidatus Omnitrophota bacterium]
MIFGKKYSERRQYKRIDCYCLIRYRALNSQGAYTENLASIRNISGGGLLFKSREYLPVGTQLEVKINFVALEKPIFVLARVVRFEANKKNAGSYRIGIFFTTIKDQDRKIITQFTESVEES